MMTVSKSKFGIHKFTKFIPEKLRKQLTIYNNNINGQKGVETTWK